MTDEGLRAIVATSTALEGLSVEELTELTEEGISLLGHFHHLKRLRYTALSNARVRLYACVLCRRRLLVLLLLLLPHKPLPSRTHPISAWAIPRASPTLRLRPS